MKLQVFCAALAVALLAVAGAAEAQSLKARQFQAKEEDYLARSVADASKRCDAPISAKIDWSTTQQDEPGTHSPSGFCGGALDAIGSLCGEPLAKEAIQKGVKTLICKMGGSRALALRDGTLTYTIDYDAANNDDFIKDYLKGHL